MGFGSWALIAKAGIDLAVAVSYHDKVPVAVMFLSFVLVDLATLWVAHAS